MTKIIRLLFVVFILNLSTACATDGAWPGQDYRRGEASAPTGLNPSTPWRTTDATPMPSTTTNETQMSSVDTDSPFFDASGKQNRVAAPSTGNKVNVGILLPLSGSEKAVGRAMLEAAQLAVLDYANNDFVLMPFDTKGTASGASRAFDEAVYNNVQLILGPVFAAEVDAIDSQARYKNIPVIAFTNDTTVANDGVYVMGFTPYPQVSRLISYAAQQGIKKFAFLGPETTYGKSVLDAVRRQINASGGDLIKSELYAADTKDFHEPIKRLADFEKRQGALEKERAAIQAKADNGEITQAAAKAQLDKMKKKDTVGDVEFEALIIADTGSRLGNLAPLLPYYDIDMRKVKLMGLGQWENVAFIKTEPAFNRAWYVGPEPIARDEFVKNFKESWGYVPPRQASIAYDAASLAAGLARANSGHPDFGPSKLTDRRGFAGIDGVFRLTNDGQTERGLAVLEIKNREITVRDPAPKRF